MAALLLMLATGCVAPLSDSAEPGFKKDIKPLLARHCLKCHGIEAREAELDLRTLKRALAGGGSGPVVVAGQPDESLLLEMIMDEKMPPKAPGLDEAQIALIRRWILAGARP